MDTALRAAQQALLPTDEDVAFYRAHGWWVSPPILPDELLDAAERGMRRFYVGDYDAPFPGRTLFDDWDWTPAHGDGLRKNDYAQMQVGELATLVHAPIIGAVAGRLAGSPTIRLWHDQLLYKPVDALGRATNVGWHTDRQYWQTCTAEDMLTAWVPFHDVDEMTGAVTFVDGSHRWEASGLDFFNTDLNALEARFTPGGEEVVKVPAVLRRGQVGFHHSRTIHGSGPNRGTEPRRSMAIHLQTAANRYRRVLDPDGQVLYHRNDDLCRRVGGAPDYTDPRLCPVLWQEPVA
jgi:hypothetical protein